MVGDNHKIETFYKSGEYPDYVWKRFRDKEIQCVYRGEVKNGKPNGLGIETHDGLLGQSKYEGQWKDGKFHGKGTHYDPFNGFKFGGDSFGEWGEFKDGSPWNGTYYYDTKYNNWIVQWIVQFFGVNLKWKKGWKVVNGENQ
jgi:hypothetical protein